MTLIVAHVTSAGAVMAADSRAAEGDSSTTTADKIWTSGGLLFGYSGTLALRDQLRAAIDAGLTSAPLPEEADWEIAASQLCVLSQPVLKAAYANFVGGPDDHPVDALGGSLLVVGRDREQHWLLEIDSNNIPARYTDDGCHTIGSEALAARVGLRFLQHYSLPGHETKHLRLLAVRTVQSCIDVLGAHLGPPVQLWQATPDGQYEEVLGDALAAVHEGIEQWTRIEQESLLNVFADHEEPAAAPLPEALTDDD